MLLSYSFHRTGVEDHSEAAAGWGDTQVKTYRAESAPSSRPSRQPQACEPLSESSRECSQERVAQVVFSD